jgi:hypothetical protein
MKQIFSDCEILSLEGDYQMPGVFIKVKKGVAFTEKNLDDCCLYSMVTNQREKEIEDSDLTNPYYKKLGMREKIKNLKDRLLKVAGETVSKILKI